MAAINVLVIDRDKVVRDLLKEELEGANYKVWAVSDFEQALALAGETNFSIIMADLKLPGIEGTEIVRKFKELHSDTSLIAIVPYHSLRLAVDAMSKGDILDYVTKPFNIEEVKLVIRRVADRQYLVHQAGQKEFYQEMSVIDSLTGIYNRRHLDEILHREVERAKRYNQTISILMIDIDDFKKYNDTYGHLAGDEILKKIGDFLVHSLRSVDLVFRYGGEEFVVMLPQTFKQGGVEVAKRLLNLGRQNIPITISIGVAAFPEDAQEKDDLLAKADSALYQAKHLGKDRICLWGE
ncbi:MAG: hypothetical protein A2166_05120 [Omnitrophica WOR_2 bacterium RBG_13_41_10]|nr:MAG: hypothetical protein A2166_05120 [Omnitrophica WOR_2 bacterium RBG_13_41_10]